MKRKRLLVFAAVGAGLYFLIQAIQRRTLSKFSYAAGGFRVHTINLSSVEFRMNMTITNESDVPAPVSQFIGRLQYQWPDRPASTLGNLSLVNPVQIPGFGQAELEFRMVTGLLGGALEILNILTNGNPFNFGSINYNNVDMTRFRILGTLKIGPLPLTINTTLV